MADRSGNMPGGDMPGIVGLDLYYNYYLIKNIGNISSHRKRESANGIDQLLYHHWDDTRGFYKAVRKLLQNRQLVISKHIKQQRFAVKYVSDGCLKYVSNS